MVMAEKRQSRKQYDCMMARVNIFLHRIKERSALEVTKFPIAKAGGNGVPWEFALASTWKFPDQGC